jgi:Leucine-rich repeat (LRR) protein
MSVEIADKIYDVDCKKLYLNYTNIKYIPDSIGNLINLQGLYLTNNHQIKTLPDSIGNLINLQRLNLNNNQINTLPNSIGNLINLQNLDLSYNQITILPDSIGNLINLQELYLYNNQITILPDSIGNLINLEKLSLVNNKINILPYEILKIKKALVIDETSYEINNLNVETEILIFSDLKTELKNLPIGLKEIWINKELKVTNIKLPFGCEIKYCCFL